ncbi:MAG: hypothetical protein J6B70_10635 [Oscillospiraceae bacterium]|nr:hypothetical protein [Oscillospiraceae bacterium]
MKKRLLALALCLVLAVSLLPITAAATDYFLSSMTVKASDVEKKGDRYYLKSVNWEAISEQGEKFNNSNSCGYHIQEIPVYTTDPSSGGDVLTEAPVAGTTYYITFRITTDGSSGVRFNPMSDFSATLEIPGYTASMIRFQRVHNTCDVYYKLTKHEHTWQLTQTDSTLTVECGNNGCPIRKMSVELKANSVTLPNSPFNAWLEGWEQLVSEFPEAKYKFDYKYKGPGDSEYRPVDPIAANAKAGEYQVGVSLWDITRGPIDPSEGTYLFVKYTAADPAVTAQTGDNRPIEIMMASVLVFSALAAAAFILDSKRKYKQ